MCKDCQLSNSIVRLYWIHMQSMTVKTLRHVGQEIGDRAAPNMLENRSLKTAQNSPLTWAWTDRHRETDWQINTDKQTNMTGKHRQADKHLGFTWALSCLYFTYLISTTPQNMDEINVEDKPWRGMHLKIVWSCTCLDLSSLAQAFVMFTITCYVLT